MERAIYPTVDIKQHEGLIKIQTTLRKQHEGIWYLWSIVERHYIGSAIVGNDFIYRILHNFHKEVYKALVLGNVDVNITDTIGQPFFVRDVDQRSEYDRLTTPPTSTRPDAASSEGHTDK